MSNSETLNEIREINLSYLVLAQRLIREDRAAAMFRLGVSEELADVLSRLTLAQLVKLASSNLLLCRFRFDDHAILSNLTHTAKDIAVQQSHASILLASQPVEAIG
ncbi:flagellar transcriptional regulator FlhD [Pandoraea sp.]|uniref:flagellar transcriptional regulator FlhD n=1 Tax=Pandoraea sp. TaxID=1883445 RepID=UPI0011FF9761|nr:flagellar transcriptional regulator FlhD [Pandoraea sp.]MBU6492750.1 flagellar transcriptional regulator FlhD [Burkholderiales bacterium]MDE2288378.1 flagellar transcriptional regulator FlhD [Burkholderiales bacterium]MDE2609465.1 flagellar transcriptional regulator FlhD [Burkholderiales bacterium]TAL55993.1 MAG: flagellar transcriptional regulator FlhD [Pandoraea sp.]TAM16738.1 MAG: flagellar transcriptional regulator FlhD [Pandoraea sp.]